MAGESEYELTGDELAVYEAFLVEFKEAEVHAAALNVMKALLKKMAGDADYLTVDGVRVLQVVRSRPNRFDGKAFQLYDPRLYERFVKPADAVTVSLRQVGSK